MKPDVGTRYFAAGTTIFREGDTTAGEAFVVIKGSVEIRKSTRGLGTSLAMVAPNGLFGEIALVDPMPRATTAVARTDTTCLVLTKEFFEHEISRQNVVMRLLVAGLLNNILALSPRPSGSEPRAKERFENTVDDPLFCKP